MKRHWFQKGIKRFWNLKKNNSFKNENYRRKTILFVPLIVKTKTVEKVFKLLKQAFPKRICFIQYFQYEDCKANSIMLNVDKYIRIHNKILNIYSNGGKVKCNCRRTNSYHLNSACRTDNIAAVRFEGKEHIPILDFQKYCLRNGFIRCPSKCHMGQ